MEYLIGLGLIISGIAVMAVVLAAIVAAFAGLAWLYDKYVPAYNKKASKARKIFSKIIDGITISIGLLFVAVAGYGIGYKIWIG